MPQGAVGSVAGWLTGLALIGCLAGIVCDEGDTPVCTVGGCAGGVYTGVGGLGGCFGAAGVAGFDVPGMSVTEGFGITGGSLGTGGTYGCGCGCGGGAGLGSEMCLWRSMERIVGLMARTLVLTMAAPIVVEPGV